jgi:hypothetical protein
MSIFDAVLAEDEPFQEANGYHETPAPAPLGVAIPFNLNAARQSFAPYSAKLAEVKAQADGIRVTNDPTASQATAIAGDVKRLAKSIDQRRKELIEEPNAYVKAVNSMAKMFTAPAEQIERLLKDKLSGYQAQRELERRKAEEEIRKAQAELYRKQQAEAKAAQVEAPPPPVPIPIKAETVTRSDTGASAHVRKVWKAEILKAREVPREFCEPSMKLINEAVKGGIREIKGVRIWEDLQTILRT